MTRKALVIGAQTGDLAGVHHDVETMTTLLTARGFAVDARTGADATRDGIREGYERLIADARHDEPTVVYYSGHGGLAQVQTPTGSPLPDLQFIVPTDYHLSTPGDFRGIIALELSVLLARLTEKTRNVTVILDCCHASHMVRGDLRVKALPYPTYLAIGEHIGMLRSARLPIDLPHVETNPWAVRMVACAPWESAYEYTDRNGRPAGILTDSFRLCLEQAGETRVPWTMLTQRVRDRVSALALGQRPEAEGPSRRYLFELEEARGGVTFAVAPSPSGRLTLPGAALLGVAAGDRFAITAVGAGVATDATTVAYATVTHTDGITVEATYELADGHPSLPVLAEAHPLLTSATSDLVRVQGDGAVAGLVHSAVAAAAGLQVVGAADEVGTNPVLAEVVVTDAVSLWDGGATPLVSAPADPAGVDRIVDELRRLARTAGLRRLAPGPGEELSEPFTVEWGRVVDGVAEPLPASGSLLHVGESIYVRLRNDSSRDLFFFVFDLGVGGAVTLITAADPGGLRLTPGREYVLGDRTHGGLEGTPLVWPASVPTGDPRPESILVIVTAARQDLSVLAHEGVGPAVPRGGSPLSRALAAAVGSATTRDWRATDEPSARYAVVRLDCALSDAPAPQARRFLVDDRPATLRSAVYPMSHPTVRSRTVAPAGPPPGKVAVRLTDLYVHRNRAIGGADVRVDSLVLTGGDGSLPAYRAETLRFGNVRDGDRLPLDNLLAYHGPAVEFLDIAWWVSRDRRNSLALSELLHDRLGDPTVQQAIGSLTALAGGPEHAALAIGACSVIVTTAYDLLSRMVGDSIGLYRTSLLASEGFGVGRHPERGTRSAQDFSFAYEVVAVG